MNQVANRFANQPMIERRVSQSYLTLTSKETSLLPHFSWLLLPSQTTMPYTSMTSLLPLPNFSWLLHPSQMNFQKAYQRSSPLYNEQLAAEPRSFIDDVSIDSWQCPMKIDKMNFQQVGNSASTQLVGSCHD